jgi:DNA (cytosine-5)-methyltransferase 1
MRQRLIFIGVRNDLPAAPRFPVPLPYRYSVRDALPDINYFDMGRKFGVVEKWASDCSPYQALGDGPSSGNGLAVNVYTDHEKRKFSIAELRRIGGFPDDFILTGTYAQQWERIGRAVPPVMMSHIAATIREKVLPLCQS